MLTSLNFISHPLKSLGQVHFGGQDSLDDQIRTAVAKFLENYDQKVPEQGAFSPIDVLVQDTPNKVTLRLAGFESGPNNAGIPEYAGKRYIEVSVASQSGISGRTQWVVIGSKQNLKEALQSDETVGKIQKRIQASIQELESYR
jgi:hypothetical protein